MSGIVLALVGRTATTIPGAPTIVTAAATSQTSATVQYTAPASDGGSPIISYTATSSPGGITGTLNQSGSGTITVNGLNSFTAYTFTVTATNAIGTSPASAASNSITTLPYTCQVFSSAGQYSWVAPAGVTSVAVVAIGGGGGGRSSSGGGGAGLGYINNQAVNPGTSYTVVVGSAGAGINLSPCDARYGTDSYFISTAVVKGGAGQGAASGDYAGTGGGGGGYSFGGGGGAGGYSGTGGQGPGQDSNPGPTGNPGSGGAGGSGANGAAEQACGYTYRYPSGGGGGTGIYGQGANGVGGTGNLNSTGGGGGGGSGGGSGSRGGSGGYPGGGGGRGCTGPFGYSTTGFSGAGGRVRIVWCLGGFRGTPSFPSTNVGV